MTDKVQPVIARRVAKVSAVTGMSSVLSIGLQLVSVPVCLSYWGNDTYGTWLALFASFTLLRTVDAGYIGYIGNKLNMLYHQEEESLRVMLASAIWGVACLGGLQLLILALIFATDSISFIMGDQHSPATMQEAVLALLILSVAWIFSGSYLGIVHRLLIPAGMMYQAAWWSMGFQVSQFSALILSAILGFSILQAACVFALVQMVIYITSAIYIKVKLPRYYPWWEGSNRGVGLVSILQSVPFSLAGVMQQGANSGLIMVVSAFLGPAAVPAFATVRTMSNLWTTLINILTTPLLPDVVRFHAMGDGQKLIAVHQAHWLLVGLVVNLSILIAFPFLETVYEIWTNSRLSFDKPLISLLLATVSLVSMNALMNVFLSGVNHSGFVLVSAAIRGGLAVLLSIFLLGRFGIIGLGIAMFLSEALVLLVTVQWFFKQELKEACGEITMPAFGWLWLSSGCVVVYLLMEGFSLGLANIVYWFAITGVVLVSIFAWRGLDEDIKTRVRIFLNLVNISLKPGLKK